MLRQRVITASILLPLTIGVLVAGGWWFRSFVTLVLTLGAWEFVKLMQTEKRKLWAPASLAVVWLVLTDAAWPSWQLLKPGLLFILLASLTWAINQYAKGETDPAAGWSLSLVGGLYLGMLGSNLDKLRGLPDGLSWSLVALGSVWLADGAAYFCGRAWGRHKLIPRVSPGKTWEGSIGGLVAGSLTAALLAWVFGFGAGLGLGLGVLISILSPIGDLGISMLKRQVGAKDSGRLLPGHGGVLDRIDSLLVTATIAYYYVIWFAQ
ncbi:MAG: phosphatidate cytidylyltransferase [Anaerolineales bacterium]|nr:phosphatidate cytidylyltransferase [Anaerolineales bacterium]